ncbi:MAG: DUF6531 domain-containing protein, partial [Gammaproteobacteria bacterium]|nr:DUF6531 domain-containing protein [Gammaproteobacteria bacterium]
CAQDVYFANAIPGLDCPDGYIKDPQTDQCIPPDPDPINHGQPLYCDVTNPVNITTGNKFQRETDYVSASDSGLRFERFYNSLENAPAGIMGGWRHTWESELEISPSGVDVTMIRADGKVIRFHKQGGVWVAGPNSSMPALNVIETLEEIPGGWRVTTPNDDIETYDSSGKLTGVTSRGGRTYQLTYNGSDELTRVENDFGQGLDFTYDVSGRLETMTDPANGVYQYEYSSGPLSGVTYPDNAVRGYVYEDINPLLLTGIVDENGDRFAYWEYDERSRVTRSFHAGMQNEVFTGVNQDIIAGIIAFVGEAQGGSRTYKIKENFGLRVPETITGDKCDSCGAGTSITYDANGFKASETDFNNVTTNYVHNTRGLETSRTEAFGTPDERTITTEWHANFRLPTKITEPGRESTFTYDGDGNQLTETVKDLVTLETRSTTFTYTADGLLETVDGPRGDVTDVTTYGYDLQGNLTSITNALSQVTQISNYDAHGNPGRITDPNNVITDLVYDTRQRLTSRTVAVGTADEAVTGFVYDDVGNLERVTLPNNAYLDYTYNAAHQLIAVADNLGNRIDYTLDKRGNRIKEDVKDPLLQLQRTQQWLYDQKNRLEKHTDGVNQETLFEYDLEGNQTAVVDPLLNRTENTYDALNRLTEVKDALNGITDYDYDGRDNLTSVTDPRNVNTTYDYNGFDELKQTVSPDSGTSTYTYDAAGNRLTQIDARNVNVTFDYDALNRLTAIHYPTASKDIVYTYDQGVNGKGRLTKITDETGSTDYAYDRRGNLINIVSVVNGVTFTVTYEYDPADNLTAVVYPDNARVEYARDAAGRVTGITHTPSGGSAQTIASGLSYQAFGSLDALTFGNDLAHNRTFDLDGRLDTLITGAVQNLDYGYDAAGNIDSITDGVNAAKNQSFGYDLLHRLTSATGVYGSLSYDYDGVGNRTILTDNGSPTSYTYGANDNRLLTEAAATYQYDAAGNITDNGQYTYIYDDRNRLVEVKDGANTVATYTYNAMGQRVKKIAGPDTTLYHYDQNGLLIAESDGAGNILMKYVYLNGQRLAMIDPTAPPLEVIVDNDDPEAGSVGEWTSSTAGTGDYEGADFSVHGATAATKIVDNEDADFSVLGSTTTWTSGTWFEGSNFMQLNPNSPPGDTVIVNDTDAEAV